MKSNGKLCPLGKLVVKALTDQDKTKTQLAADIGTSPQYLSYILYGVRSGEKYLPALIAAELSLVTMTVFDQGVQQRDTRKIAKRARDCFHMVESTPPKRRRSRGHKHHRVRTGQHTAVAIGCCHLGMQGSVVEQLRQIRCQTRSPASLYALMMRGSGCA